MEMEIVTLFKGDAGKSVKCRLYRFPTKQERIADLGESEERWEYMKATPWESGFVHSKAMGELFGIPEAFRRTVSMFPALLSGY